MTLFSNVEWLWCFNLKNLQAIRYQAPPSVETTYFPYSLIKPDRNLFSYKHVSLFGYRECENFLLFGSIATHNHIILSQPWLVSHQQCILIFSSSYDMTTFVDCTFESISRLLHDFSWLCADKRVPWKHFWLKVQENTNIIHSQYLMKVFCFFYWTYQKWNIY